MSRYNYKNHHHAAIIIKKPSHMPRELMNNHRKVNYWIASSSRMTWFVTINTVSSSDSYEDSKTQVLKVLLRNLANIAPLRLKETLSTPFVERSTPFTLACVSSMISTKSGEPRWVKGGIHHSCLTSRSIAKLVNTACVKCHYTNWPITARHPELSTWVLN